MLANQAELSPQEDMNIMTKMYIDFLIKMSKGKMSYWESINFETKERFRKSN